jgi:hypothetical protein
MPLEEALKMDDKDMLERLRRKDAGEETGEGETFFSESLGKRQDFEEDPPFWNGEEPSRKVQYFSLGSGGSCLGCLVALLILGFLPFLLMGTFLWGVVLFAIIGVFGLLRWLF